MTKSVQILGFLVLMIGFFSCQSQLSEKDKEDKPLARVFKQKLMASDMEGMFIDSPSPQDSILMANTFVENWVRENLLMQEAEKNIPKDLNIDELVRHYRASLIKHNYEKLLIELQLDSIVQESEIMDYYDLNKEQFKLDNPLFQLDYCKIPTEVGDLNAVKNWWSNNSDSMNYHSLLEYCGNYASFFILGNEKWVNFDLIKNQLPNSFDASQLVIGKNLNVVEDGYLHLLKVKQRLEKGAFAPVGYVKDKAERFLLHKRKMKLLEDKKEEIYDREMRLKNIEIYTK